MPYNAKTHFRSGGNSEALRTQFNALVADNAALRAAIVAITAQLDLDAGVTDTDYAANNDPAAVTALNLTF